MAAADETVGAIPSTIEADGAVHKLTITAARASLANVGDFDVFLQFDSSGVLSRDGLQHVGEIQLEPGDSIPLPENTKFLETQCKVGETTSMWYLPNVK